MPNVRFIGYRAAAVLAITFLMTTFAWSQPMSTVTGVKVSQKGEMLNVEVGASGRVQHRSKVLTSPQKFIVVDVFPAKLKEGVPASTEVNKGLVEKVRVKQYAENTVRIYVDVVSPPEFKVVTAADAKGLTLAINANKMASGGTKSAPATTASTAPQSSPRVAATSGPKRATTSSSRVAAVTPSRSVAFDGQGKAPVSALRARKAPRREAPKQKLVTLDFVNADLVFVLKVLAKEMNRNIYVGPTVQGSVTVTLKDVPVEGAMALILQMQENEYDYKLLDGPVLPTIVVAAPEKLEEVADDILRDSNVREAVLPENSVRMEYLLEEAPSAKVVDFLTGQYPKVKFTPHPTMNGFYANGSKEDLLQIKRELATLDRVPEPPPPPLREFLPVKYGDINEIRSLLSALVPDVSYNVDTRLKVLIAEGSPGAIDQVREMLAELDRPLDQVMVDLKVVDLSDNGTKNLGVTWGSGQNAFSVGTTFSEQAVGQQVVRTPQGPVLQPNAVIQSPNLVPIGIGTFARSPLSLNAAISFLVTQNEAKILASPRVAALSGTESLIHIGDKYPIVYFDPRAGQFQVQYVDIGIKLDVTANVKADGYVVIDVRPEVSTLLELINNQYPRTAVRIVETTMRVKDGDTIIIGGLIREEDIQNVSKVPLLGDLPVLGPMFRTTLVTKTRNEVVLMMTPNIMR